MVNNFTSLSHLSLTKVTCGSLEPYFGSTSEIVDVGRLFSLPAITVKPPSFLLAASACSHGS
ncbi:uncharacterized protein LAESUDRAFT_729697 [Laetiporus sulphureus 93-53]|uniref:Uncharacterized protein n=1 Tax=Laetiporus sulphureus 93-53 TaxID=1314785 RepID=A0A165CKE0_9APHY|nr:uncharacterized protein LAESUDRAFT_729697 [Laetiporus sulphureus 93-53]KZT02972.1 hypothetical protein LAESUDRAFT_729697 [Laetiporus sulphureus 93-53]